MGPMEDRVQRLLEPTVTGLGYELLGIEYLSQGKHSRLRLFIDSPDGIGVKDCETVSRQVSGVLDVEDPIKGHYSLEVSSPGIDRPLFRPEHYARFIGEQVKLRTRLPVDGQRNFQGEILGVDGDQVHIKIDDNAQLEISCAEIEKANLIPKF